MGARDDAPGHGPALHLVASYPSDGQGTNAAPDVAVSCDSPTPDCPVPTNAAIELRFDRFLRPSAGLVAGVSLYSGNPPANGIGLRAEYDLIERVVVLRPTRSLQPNTLYTAELVPSASPGTGFWAFDGAPLEEAAVPLRFSFTTGSGPVDQPPVPSSPDSCDTLPTGAFVSCISCHTSRSDEPTNSAVNYPPMGLDLSSPQGLFYTAVGRIAHQSETGNTAANTALRTPSRFGVQMNIVDPGNPATSYLMYKLLQKPENFQLDASEAGCVTGYHVPVSEAGCTAPDADEGARVREWFVHGEPMPKNGRHAVTGEPVAAATTHANLVRIAGWIAGGAACADPR